MVEAEIDMDMLLDADQRRRKTEQNAERMSRLPDSGL